MSDLKSPRTSSLLDLINFDSDGFTINATIIKNNTERRFKELWTDNAEGVKIETFVGSDENNEAAYAALQIKNIMARNSTLKYSDFAVFSSIRTMEKLKETPLIRNINSERNAIVSMELDEIELKNKQLN